MKRLLLVVLCLLVVGSGFFIKKARNTIHQNEIMLAENDNDDKKGIEWGSVKPGRG